MADDDELSSFLNEIADVSSLIHSEEPITNAEPGPEQDAQPGSKRKLDEIITVSAPVTIAKKAELRTESSTSVSFPQPNPALVISIRSFLPFSPFLTPDT